MSKGLSLTLASIFFLCAFASVLKAQHSEFQCSESTDAHDHATLLEYAVFAEVAYQGTGEYSVSLNKHCPRGTPTPARVAQINVRNVPIILVDSAIGRLHAQEPAIEYFRDIVNGEEVIACNRERNLDPRLAIGFRYVWRNEKLSLLTKVILVSSSLTLEHEQQLRVMELQRTSDGGRHLGIQGTDIFSVPQINSVIQELVEKSCIFEFALEVAEAFFNSCDTNIRSLLVHDSLSAADGPLDNTIVGHSLGGAIAQYVANHRSLEGIARECGSGNERFRAYSFNSFGITPATAEAAYRERTNKIFSVRIAGEFLERIEMDLERAQIGHLYRYAVSSTVWNFVQRINRHRIRKVQREICRCRNGTGNTYFQYTPPNPGG